MDLILTTFLNAISAAFGVIHVIGLAVFGLISGVAWIRAGMYSIGQDAGSVLANAVLLLVSLCVYLVLLLNMQPWVLGLLDAASSLGASIGGLSGASFRTPSAIFTEGHKALAPLMDYLAKQTGWIAILNVPSILNFGFAYLIGIFAFMIVTLSICLTLVSAHISLLLAALTFPFAPLSATSYLAEFAIGLVAASILRLFIQSALVGLSIGLFQTLVIATTPAGDPDWWSSLTLVGGSVLFAILCVYIPAESTRMLVGRASSLGIGSSEVMRGIATGARGTIGMVTGGAAVLSGVTSWIKAARS